MFGQIFVGREYAHGPLCQANILSKPLDISSLISGSGHDRISILKIDIEGAEAVLFRENYELWLGFVDHIVIELHDDSAFGSASDLFNNAISGYDFSISRFGELHHAEAH